MANDKPSNGGGQRCPFDQGAKGKGFNVGILPIAQIAIGSGPDIAIDALVLCKPIQPTSIVFFTDKG